MVRAKVFPKKKKKGKIEYLAGTRAALTRTPEMVLLLPNVCTLRTVRSSFSIVPKRANNSTKHLPTVGYPPVPGTDSTGGQEARPAITGKPPTGAGLDEGME